MKFEKIFNRKLSNLFVFVLLTTSIIFSLSLGYFFRIYQLEYGISQVSIFSFWVGLLFVFLFVLFKVISESEKLINILRISFEIILLNAIILYLGLSIIDIGSSILFQVGLEFIQLLFSYLVFMSLTTIGLFLFGILMYYWSEFILFLFQRENANLTSQRVT